MKKKILKLPPHPILIPNDSTPGRHSRHSAVSGHLLRGSFPTNVKQGYSRGGKNSQQVIYNILFNRFRREAGGRGRGEGWRGWGWGGEGGQEGGEEVGDEGGVGDDQGPTSRDAVRWLFHRRWTETGGGSRSSEMVSRMAVLRNLSGSAGRRATLSDIEGRHRRLTLTLKPTYRRPTLNSIGTMMRKQRRKFKVEIFTMTWLTFFLCTKWCSYWVQNGEPKCIWPFGTLFRAHLDPFRPFQKKMIINDNINQWKPMIINYNQW